MPAGDMGDRLMEGNPVTKQMETDSSFRNKNFHLVYGTKTSPYASGEMRLSFRLRY